MDVKMDILGYFIHKLTYIIYELNENVLKSLKRGCFAWRLGDIKIAHGWSVSIAQLVLRCQTVTNTI